uniref:Uncharacterized protein n=1 Tax=Dunaliella tertiolecta TaxID=3047 RepID=A0A7S3VNE2_DUNTE
MASLISVASSLRDSSALRAATLSFSLLRIVMQIGLPKQASKLFLNAALPAQLMTTLPELLILDPQWGAPLLGYFLCHAGTSASFYYTMEVHCFLASICRGFGTHALCLCAFLAFHQSWKLLRSLGGLHIDDLPKAAEQLEQLDAQQEQLAGQRAESQQQEQKQEHKQVEPAQELQQIQQAQKQQRSQPQEVKERKHMGEQLCDGSASFAPQHQMSKSPGPKIAPLSSANARYG